LPENRPYDVTAISGQSLSRHCEFVQLPVDKLSALQSIPFDSDLNYLENKEYLQRNGSSSPYRYAIGQKVKS
jgi:hypothetical protein